MKKKKVSNTKKSVIRKQSTLVRFGYLFERDFLLITGGTLALILVAVFLF